MAARRRQAQAAARDGRRGQQDSRHHASFSQPIRDNVLESISQIDGQIVIKVFGDDLDVLRDQSLAVLKQVETVPAWHARSSTGWASCRRSRCASTRPRRALRPQRVRHPGRDRDRARRQAGDADVEGEQHFGVAVRLDEPERTLVRMQSLLVATSPAPMCRSPRWRASAPSAA